MNLTSATKTAYWPQLATLAFVAGVDACFSVKAARRIEFRTAF